MRYSARNVSWAVGMLFLALPLAGATNPEAQDAGSRDTEAPAVVAPAPSVAADELSSADAALRDKMRRVLAAYHRRSLNSRDHNCWELMHAIVAYGVDSQYHRGGPDGELVNSIGWLCFNGPCHGQRLLTIERGRVAARKGVEVQGHHGQFLAILAQSRLTTDYPLKVDGRDFTIADLIESEKLGCQSGTELTFKLISLAHYLDLDTTWKAHNGQEWTVERLVREELAAPIRGAACGGTHRLMGLAYAVRKCEKTGRPIKGEYARAKQFLDDYHRYTFSLQNADGSFSTEWFNRRGARSDIDRRLQTTGHILEWLSYSLPENQLDDPRVVKAVDYLATILNDAPSRRWEIGPLGHGLHALAIYESRRFKPLDGEAKPASLASRIEIEQTDVEESAELDGELPVELAPGNDAAATNEPATDSPIGDDSEDDSPAGVQPKSDQPDAEGEAGPALFSP